MILLIDSENNRMIERKLKKKIKIKGYMILLIKKDYFIVRFILIFEKLNLMKCLNWYDDLM